MFLDTMFAYGVILYLRGRNMAQRENLINQIVGIEWKMFQKVQNIGGRASCQDDRKTFEVMRFSQFMSWSEAALESYLNDLTDAERQGRNLLTEKYARMLESTSPSEYAHLENLLPPLTSEVISLIERIVEIVLPWEEELSQKFPYILGRGRPIHSSEDTAFVTSLETYLRGELATYSLPTLELIHDNILNQKSENVNGSEIVLDHMIRQSGFKSLEEANGKLKAQISG
jgi:Protein of unknown function (DUF4125)